MVALALSVFLSSMNMKTCLVVLLHFFVFMCRGSECTHSSTVPQFGQVVLMWSFGRGLAVVLVLFMVAFFFVVTIKW